MTRGRGPAVLVVSIGIAVGIAVSGLALGLGATHDGCTAGPVRGWSGPLAVPLALGVPPPGGLVNWSFSFANQAGTMVAPVNSTTADYELLNWTAVSQTPVVEPGWGPSVACPSFALRAPESVGGGCSGCPLAPGVPAGMGERTVLPRTGTFASYPTPLLNGSYPSAPVASFRWAINAAGDIYVKFLTNSTEYLGHASGYQAHPGAPYAGLELTLSVNAVGFGVPIHLANGTEVVLPSATPLWLPGSPYGLQVSYIFPGAGDNVTWEMFAAGGGSAYPLGGYLFEQVG